jgi:hypothetical protein
VRVGGHDCGEPEIFTIRAGELSGAGPLHQMRRLGIEKA